MHIYYTFQEIGTAQYLLGFRSGFTHIDFTHILQGYFTGSGSYCPSASEATLKNMGKTTDQSNKNG